MMVRLATAVHGASELRCGIVRRVTDREFMQELDLAATDVLESGTGSDQLRAGVRLLNSWRDRSYGAVLFWVDGGLGFWHGDHLVMQRDLPALHLVHCELVDGTWRSRGTGSAETESVSEILADRGPGLHRIGGGSAGDPVRITYAIASPEVSTIELRSDQGHGERRPGAGGFCVLGITHEDPITYARGLDRTGAALPGEPLLL
jgi:hypothetical protein